MKVKKKKKKMKVVVMINNQVNTELVSFLMAII